MTPNDESKLNELRNEIEEMTPYALEVNDASGEAGLELDRAYKQYLSGAISLDALVAIQARADALSKISYKINAEMMEEKTQAVLQMLNADEQAIRRAFFLANDRRAMVTSQQ